MQIDPEGWLSNFDAEDKPIACALLESFIFFNDDMTSTLLESALASVASEPVFARDPSTWEYFLNNAVITFPTGEVPNPTDSGYLFVRHIRQNLGFSEEQIYDPSGAVNKLESQHVEVPLILVDDIVGSGDQVIETWERKYPLGSSGYSSLKDQWENDKVGSVYVVAPIVTWYAEDRLAKQYPDIKIRAAHTLGAEYSAKSDETALVPESLRAGLVDMIIKYAPRIGMTASDAFGHHDLGLNMAFDHAMPDLTLPMIWSDTPNWKPLRRRS